MFTWYEFFTFLHVLAVIVWIGGVITLAILNARLAREVDGNALRLLSRQNEFFGSRVLGPAAIVTLVAGIALMAQLGAGFTLWMVWGLLGVFGSILLGGVVLRRAGQEVATLSAGEWPDETRLEVLRRRLAIGGAANIVLLVSTVWAMVFKPTL